MAGPYHALSWKIQLNDWIVRPSGTVCAVARTLRRPLRRRARARPRRRALGAARRARAAARPEALHRPARRAPAGRARRALPAAARARGRRRWSQRARSPPPSGARVYELTERGRELEPVILELGRFGSVAPFPDGDATFGPDALAIALKTLYDARRRRREHRAAARRPGRSGPSDDGEALSLERGRLEDPDATIEAEPGPLAARALARPRPGRGGALRRGRRSRAAAARPPAAPASVKRFRARRSGGGSGASTALRSRYRRPVASAVAVSTTVANSSLRFVAVMRASSSAGTIAPAMSRRSNVCGRVEHEAHVVAEVAAHARGRLAAVVGGDAAQVDRPHALRVEPRLQRRGAVEGTSSPSS